MKLRRLPMCLAVLSVATPSVLFGQKVVVEHTVASGDTHGYVSPWQKLEAGAKLENPSDANSVHELIGAILAFPHSFGPIPPVMREIVEQRLVQAEMDYKFGRTPGIPEANIVKLVNMLADKFSLPDFAHTTPHQVEVLRFGIELSSPSFMGLSSPPVEPTAVSAGTAELSPAQATHILFILADQKMINPDYQLSPDEWEQIQYKPAMDRLLKYKELRDSGQLGNTVKRGVLISGASIKDLRTQISQRVTQMSLTDGLDLVNEAFEMEGIRK